MDNYNPAIDAAVSKVLAARHNLRSAQADGMKTFRKIISELKNVTFMPSMARRADIESGREHALANALDEDGIAPISFVDENGVPKQGCITSVRVDEEGFVSVQVQEMLTEQIVDVAADNTWDADLLLEFVRAFGPRE